MIAFVRHGQTAVNRDGKLQGRADATLTELGHEQAARLGAWFAAKSPPGRAVGRIVSSPLRRAQQTAAAIASALGLDVDVDDRLVELDYGEWDERPLRDIPASEWARWRANPAFAPPAGESLLDVTARVVSFCEDDRADDFVVAVSHVSPIKAAVCWALGVDAGASWRMHLDLASVTRLAQHADGPPFLASYNETT